MVSGRCGYAAVPAEHFEKQQYLPLWQGCIILKPKGIDL